MYVNASSDEDAKVHSSDEDYIQWQDHQNYSLIMQLEKRKFCTMKKTKNMYICISFQKKR